MRQTIRQITYPDHSLKDARADSFQLFRRILCIPNFTGPLPAAFGRNQDGDRLVGAIPSSEHCNAQEYVTSSHPSPLAGKAHRPRGSVLVSAAARCHLRKLIHTVSFRRAQVRPRPSFLEQRRVLGPQSQSPVISEINSIQAKPAGRPKRQAAPEYEHPEPIA